MDKEYAGIAGVKSFVEAAVKLAYGNGNTGNIAAVQSISGTGALRIGATLLSRFYPLNRQIFMPTPTWGNHGPIFKDAGLSTASYRYFDARTNGLDFDGR